MPEITAYALGMPCWTDLGTSDAAGAQAFYGSLFGWTFDVGGPELGGYTRCLRGGRAVAGLMPGEEGAPASWNTYFAVADAEATADRVIRAGGKVVAGPIDISDLGAMVVALDPVGNSFGMWQAGSHLGAELVGEHGAMVWQELATRDLPSAESFYGEVFGFDSDVIEARGGAAYRVLKVSDVPIGGILQMTDAWPDGLPSQWMTYFLSDDAGQVAAHAADAGGRAIVAPFDSGYGTVAVIQDPQGATFAVIQSARG